MARHSLLFHALLCGVFMPVGAFRTKRFKHVQGSLSTELKTDSIAPSASGKCVQELRPLLRSLTVAGLFDAARNWNYSWWEWPMLSNTSAYKKHWDGAAKEVPVFPTSKANATFKWGDLIDEESYAYERGRLMMLGRLSEDSGYAVNDSAIRGVCDLSVHTMRFLVHDKTFLERLWLELPGTVCLNTTLSQLEEEVRKALEQECLDECTGAMTTMLSEVPCDELKSQYRGNKTKCEEMFEKLLNQSQQCLELPYDVLEVIAERSSRLRCMPFPPPSVLWQIDDKGPGEITQEEFGGFGAIAGIIGVRVLIGDTGSFIGNTAASGLAYGIGSGLGKDQGQAARHGAVCMLPPEANKTRNKEDIVQKGMCPEGMKCKCPMTRLRERQRAGEIRKEGSLFFVEGVASIPSLVAQAKKSLTRVLMTGTMSVGLQAAVVNSLTVPSFLLIAGFRVTAQALMAYATFECQTTVGCWPQEPDRVSLPKTPDACRAPAKAKEGGSPVWFLPPPGLRMKHSKGFCVLDKCKREDWMESRVGLGRSETNSRDGKPGVYNCQPLRFEIMTTQQRGIFIEKLEDSGIEAEYSLNDARKYMNENA